MSCPECQYTLKENDQYALCDNDCGTVLCIKCDTEYYIVYEGIQSAIGHNPDCGNYSCVEEDSDIEIRSS